MLKNLWSRIELQCMKHHVPMYVYEGAATPFYACPKYMLKDENHPDGHEEGEPGCANRISFEDYRHLVEKISADLENAFLNGEMPDLTGSKYRWKNVDAVIDKYSDKKIILSVLNKKEIGTWH